MREWGRLNASPLIRGSHVVPLLRQSVLITEPLNSIGQIFLLAEIIDFMLLSLEKTTSPAVKWNILTLYFEKGKGVQFSNCINDAPFSRLINDYTWGGLETIN